MDRLGQIDGQNWIDEWIDLNRKMDRLEQKDGQT